MDNTLRNEIGNKADEDAFRYIRQKVDQLLTVMGTLPLNPEELDDKTLIALDPIGIIAESFRQILEHLNETNNQLELARDEIQKILDSVGTAIVVVDRELNILSFNRRSEETIFEGIEHPENRNLCDLIPATHSQINRELFERIIKGGSASEIADLELNNLHYHVVATPISNSDGKVQRVIFSYSDITDRIITEEKLRQASVVFENASEGVVITDAQSRIVAVNQAFEAMTGYSENEVLGKNPSFLQSGRHDANFYERVWHDIEHNGSWRGELWDRRKDGAVIPLIVAISQMRRDDGSISGYVSIFTDISSIKASEEKLDFLAYHDPLTQLPNRLLFSDRLQHAIQRARRESSKLAVVFIDLDRFKNINDSLGHHLGDRLLIHVAERFTEELRSSDTVARLGGDEFIILLEDIPDTTAVTKLCRNLIHAFRRQFEIDEHELHIGLSLGISIYPDDGGDVDSLVKNADAAMYRAKEEGRNDFRLYTPELSSQAYERLSLEQALRRAIELEQFSLHYQPQLELETGKVIGAEALLRFEHPTLGMVPPDKFIPLAEESGLIIPIGEWVLEEACKQAAKWLKKLPGLRTMAVNVSGIQFLRGQLDKLIPQLLHRYNIEASAIELEITENQLMSGEQNTTTLLSQFNAMGLALAIDDFGTGYSSLSYLKRFPVDKLKIDKSFVRDMTYDPDDAAIARSIVALGHSMGLKIVAEGIEQAEQETMLRELGCEYVQGYYYSRPLPAEQFELYMQGIVDGEVYSAGKTTHEK